MVGYFEVEQQEEPDQEEEVIISDTKDPQETPISTFVPVRVPAVDHSAQIKKLQKQDERNREIMNEHIVEDAKSLIKTVNHYSGDLSDLEIKMMYFFMMSAMSRDKERLLMPDVPDDDFPNFNDKVKVIENLTNEKMALIVREYVRVRFNDIHLGNVMGDYFMAFVRQHCPEQLAGITQKHSDIYEKRKNRIEEQLAELTTTASEPFLAEDMTEQTTSEEATKNLAVDDSQMLQVA